MAREGLTFEGLKALAGQELGVSGWITVDQEMIDRFADCTGDRQWIHVDVERTRKESPFRKPIAHGYLTLSLITAMALDIDAVPENTQAAFIHGLDAVRFIAPVVVGSRVRMRTVLLDFEAKGRGQYLLRCSNTVEIDGNSRPALTAEVLVMLYERRRKPSVLILPLRYLLAVLSCGFPPIGRASARPKCYLPGLAASTAL